MPLNFAAVDFETANHDPSSVCAIGIAFVRSGRVSETLHLLVRPPSRVFVPVVCVHRMTWGDVRHEPCFADVWSEIGPRLRREVLVAHSAAFDKRILAACLRRFRIAYNVNDFICTRALATNVLGIRPANLPHVCRRLGIPLVHHHRAGSDAEAAAKIAIRAARRLNARTARALLSHCEA